MSSCRLGVTLQLQKQVGKPQRQLVKRGPSYQWGKWLILVLCFRIGEASNPGPAPGHEWTFGLCNPSGLTSKTDHVARMPGSVWVCCETHLTKPGVAQLKHGLRVLQSPFQYVAPGHPCDPRSSQDVGTFSGVLMVSQYPARALAHQFPTELFETSRLQVAGLCVNQAWIHVGMIYGVPKSVSHQQAKYQTECLLEALIDRVALQTTGPRILCGDINYQPHELQQLARLKALGFREAQDVALQKWGFIPQPTGKGDRRIDQIWLSPELQKVLVSLRVEDGWWADHAMIQCTFASSKDAFEIDHWEMPLPFPWPGQWDAKVEFNTALDPSLAYAQMWHCFEQTAISHLHQTHRAVTPQQCGRGTTLDTVKRKQTISPCKLGREGDEQPMYLGVSLQHNRWFRQFRRLQALVRNVSKRGFHPTQVEQRIHLWQAVRNSPGFAGGFARWWTVEGLLPKFPSGFPLELPELDTLSLMTESFRVKLRSFEASLDLKQKGIEKSKRKSDLSFVFRDCKRENPPLVDALIQTQFGTIEAVNSDDQSLVFTEPVKFNDHDPIVGCGRVLSMIQSDHDQLWVEDVRGLEPGDVVVQEKAITTDTAILNEFQSVWAKRWIKLQHLAEGQWDQICGFIQRAFPPLEWDFRPWTAGQVEHVIATKKKRSATGADGVSKRDLHSLPPSAFQTFADMYNAIEASHQWPKQLQVGIVSSLDKLKGGSSVDSYRPITIYPLLYRAWSSHRARQTLKKIAKVLPSSVCGGVPGKQARAVWFEVSQLLEEANFTNDGWQGVMLDIKRAFNALPRHPICAILRALNVPNQLAMTWSSYLAGQVRRFKVRQSIGHEIPSCVGLPEGCGLSVLGMVLIDWLFDLWLNEQWRLPKQLYLFVDDWHVAFQEVSEYPVMLQHIRSFANLLDLEIDLKKSFAWSTDASDRKLLKEGDLAVTLAARDLGSHQNFSLRSGNKIVTERIKDLQHLWPKLKKSVAPYRSKVIAI